MFPGKSIDGSLIGLVGQFISVDPDQPVGLLLFVPQEAHDVRVVRLVSMHISAHYFLPVLTELFKHSKLTLHCQPFMFVDDGEQRNVIFHGVKKLLSRFSLT